MLRTIFLPHEIDRGALGPEAEARIREEIQVSSEQNRLLQVGLGAAGLFMGGCALLCAGSALYDAANYQLQVHEGRPVAANEAAQEFRYDRAGVAVSILVGGVLFGLRECADAGGRVIEEERRRWDAKAGSERT